MSHDPRHMDVLNPSLNTCTNLEQIYFYDYLYILKENDNQGPLQIKI